MKQLISSRLAAQIQRRTTEHAYTDKVTYTTPAGKNFSGECSFTENPSKRGSGAGTAYGDFQIIDAEIRLSFITPQHGGRFTITDRYGMSVTEKTFEILDIYDYAALGFVCTLKKVIT